MLQSCIDNHVSILEEELVCALGCTEPIAVALAAAIAADALGSEPESMSVSCSGNIIKNVKSVTVPNSGGMRGIRAASTLGAVAGDAHRALEVLEGVTPEGIERTQQLLASGFCDVGLEEGVPNLYIRVVASGAGHTVCTTILDRHTNITELTFDGQDIDPTPYGGQPRTADGAPASDGDLRELSLESVWNVCHELDIELIRDRIRMQIDANTAISAEGLTNDWGARIGKTLLASRPNDITTRARAAAAAGSDARMSGCAMPVCIVCGSGNQGITCTLPVVEYGHELGIPEDEILRYVALSDLSAVHVTRFIGELAAFCG
ncbi:MAG: serine dehydratase subunit alpha family protein, partial [Atopobiaceae bacterium]|nr:serine dehydratase subunit alpha family protein [Atopobiaceae bacterium]